MSLPDDVRSLAARVVASASFVEIVEAAIEPYAQALPASNTAPEPPPEDLERAAALSLQLNAINFGSGWFPTLRKPPGLSGFRTVEAGVHAHGPWTAEELRRMDARTIAQALDQDPGHELMALFARALRELGEHVDASFLDFARSGGGSAVALAERLARMPTWQDPLFKRAQIAPWDLHRRGIAPAGDVERLTMFADNLVPHVLRLDGVLRFAPGLVDRIEREELLAHGSTEELEIRACGLQAVDRLAAAHGGTTAAEVDETLWNRGADPRYKAVPRHRSRCTAY